jgi:hypothetical protein
LGIDARSVEAGCWEIIVAYLCRSTQQMQMMEIETVEPTQVFYGRMGYAVTKQIINLLKTEGFLFTTVKLTYLMT